MTADQTDAPFTVDTQTGARAIVAGIEASEDTVFAPRLPWEPLGLALRVLPLSRRSPDPQGASRSASKSAVSPEARRSAPHERSGRDPAGRHK